MKAELWKDHEIRFVEKTPGEWWAVAADVATALSFSRPADMVRMVEAQDKGVHKVRTLGGEQDMLILTEYGIYQCVFNSNKPEAKAFKRWVFGVIKQLRESAGLEGYEVFRMLDKEHQRKQMEALRNSLRVPAQIDFIKANTIANKAVSNLYGHQKMVKKGDMPPEMLRERETVLEDVVSLMALNDRYNMGLSVSEQIYRRAGRQDRPA